MKPVLGLVLAISLILSLLSYTGCSASGRSSFDINTISSYHDVPGVTDEEIAAIEAVKASRESLSYGQTLSTELFVLPGGVYAGFTSKLCGFLSEFFGIEFEQELHEWPFLKSGLNLQTIDFTGDLTMTEERIKHYRMSHPIAERSLVIYTLEDRAGAIDERNIEGLAIGFLTGTVNSEIVSRYYPDINYNLVNVDEFKFVEEMLRSGEIDAFIAEDVTAPLFDDNESIRSAGIFPLAYTSVSMSTVSEELAPFISVINKYIAVGGIDRFYDYYREGDMEYAKFNLSKSFSIEERSYIAGLAIREEVVPVLFEQENYPVSFYNGQDNEFQGFAVDIIGKISELTGIQFENISPKDAPWSDIMYKLKFGEAAMVTQLLYSDARKDGFLWSRAYATSHYALISSIDYPALANYQVIRSNVGLISNTGFEDMYRAWFPDGGNIKMYDTYAESLTALEKNEIDLLMASEYTLLHQTNFREKPGYKVNIRFGAHMDSMFGFNKNETELRSIVDKALPYIDTDTIVKGWTERVFDYSTKYAMRSTSILLIFVVALAIVLVLLALQLIKNRRIRNELQQKTTTLSTIFEAMSDFLFSKDSNLRYTSCNPSFERLTGVPESEIIGKRSSEVFAGREHMAARFNNEDAKVISDRRSLVTENWCDFPDGSRRLFESIKSPLLQNGEVVGLMGISRDITEHREAIEAAESASKAKSAFLAHMSHEIRTPMNAITGMAELVLRENIPPSVHEYVLGVKQAGASLLSIINDILDFSKIEAGALQIASEEYSFSSLINDVIIIMRMKVREKPILFTANIDCDIPEKLVGDGTRIRQIILNLLGNAVNYTNEGFVSLKIKGKPSGDSVTLNIDVSDSGIGIKESDISRLFENFVRFERVKNKDVPGTGLGLSITQTLCYSMGGDISVQSVYGSGSTFTITIPQKIGGSDEKFASVQSPETKRVLVFEKRKILTDSMAESLDGLGVPYKLASSYEELHSELANRFYPFVFAPSFLALDASRAIKECGNGSQLVLMTEIGETPSMRDARIISQPVYSASIANALNDEEEHASYGEKGDYTVRFSAPDANVLIVDDLETNLRVTKGLLTPYKMRVDVCISGAEAIRLARINQYDIVFMDHMMPEMDGIEATNEIRALEDGSGRYKNLPIIALTANAVSGVREMFLNNGMDDFLAKPIDISKLNGLLEKWIPDAKKERLKNGVRHTVDSASAAGFSIEGVDIQAGITMTGGTLDNYIRTLEIFHMDGLDKTGKIREYLESGDIRLYTVCVHSLKSASASLGAAELSELAKTLELAGSRGDMTFIRQNTGSFLEKLDSLLKDIEAVLVNNGSVSDSGVSCNIEEELSSIGTALLDRDAGEVNDIMDRLGAVRWTGESGDVFKEMSKNIFLFDYETAALLSERLLELVRGKNPS